MNYFKKMQLSSSYFCRGFKKKSDMKRIVIVGATSGIGEGLARLYAEQEEMRVGLMGRRRECLERLAAFRPSVFETEVCDVTDTELLERKLECLSGRLGGLDLLILSSGTGDLNPALDYAVERSALLTNVVGWTCAVDWAVRFFERQGHGHLVVITSAGGLRGSGAAPAYNATKAFQMNYVEGIRQRLAGRRLPVRVTDIRPGFVDTAMAKGDGLFWVASVEKACRQMMRAIERRRSVVYVTRRWRAVAWVYRHLPDGLYMKMAKV